MKKYTYKMEWVIEVTANSKEEAIEMLPPIWQNDTFTLQDESLTLISEEGAGA